VGLSNRSSHLDLAGWLVDCRSCLSRAHNIWNWDADRVDWCAGLFFLAQACAGLNPPSVAAATYSAAIKSISHLGCELFLYACKIKKTTDGRRCGAFGEARKTLQIIAQRCFARDVQINEQSGAAQNGQDQAQKAAKEKATIERAEAV